MKTITFGFLAACFTFLSVDAEAAPPAKVRISATKKRQEAVRAKGSDLAKSTVPSSYAIELKNISSGDLGNLTVNYIVFVERQGLGEKKTAPPKVERVTGSKTVEMLTKRMPQIVSTNEVALKTENVVGNLIYSDGGRIRAEDSMMGIWVRVSLGEELIGEYISPASIAKQGWEKR